MMSGWLRVLGRPLATGRCAVDRADAIVVLGAPLRSDGGVGVVLAERVLAGVELWRQGVAPLIVLSGGRTRGAARSEADAMADEARRLGAPDSSLVVEGESQNTAENALRVAALLATRGLRRVVVVTTPFHLRRALRWFRRAGVEAEGWLIVDSVQFRDPRRGLRWVLREYGSWLVSWAIDACRWLGARPMFRRGR